jgi:lysozyme family protein
MGEAANESVTQIAQEIVLREGGYVNDPDDPGGATNFGVTIHTMRRLGLDLDGDGRINAADVRHLTREQAVNIFLKHYFVEPKITRLPEALQASVFDMYVNAGNNGVKILQRLCTKMGFECSSDGAIGPLTVSTVTRAFDAAPLHLADAYAIERRNYYFRLADKRAASRKYARTRAAGKGGWITRAEHFMAAKYHLTAEQFQQRIAQWA